MKRVSDAAPDAPMNRPPQSALTAALPVVEGSDGASEVRLCRRQFLHLASGVALTAFVVPALAGCEVGEVLGSVGPATFSFDVAQPAFTPLGTIGSVVAVDSGQSHLLLVRTSATEVVALDRLCTHQACDMSPDQSGRWASATFQMTCRCHGARFDCTNGNVLAGPATTPLRKYVVTFDAATGKGSVALS